MRVLMRVIDAMKKTIADILSDLRQSHSLRLRANVDTPVFRRAGPVT